LVQKQKGLNGSTHKLVSDLLDKLATRLDKPGSAAD